MSDQTSKSVALVKNPLTVIAIFAGLAEVAATIALPQLVEDVQRKFVWFVMLFPSGLVFLFFGTLWWKHKVLYAPSDYKDEKNFMEGVRPATSKELEDNFNESIADEVISSKSADVGAALVEGVTQPSTPRAEKIRRDQFALLESLVVQQIASEENLNFARNVAINNDRSYVYDAISETSSRIVAIEVLYSRYSNFAMSRIARLRHQLLDFAQRVPLSKLNGSKFVLAVITDELNDTEKDKLRAQLEKLADRLSVPLKVEIRLFDKTALLKRGET